MGWTVVEAGGGGQDGGHNLGTNVLGGDGRLQPYQAGAEDFLVFSDYNPLLFLQHQQYDQRSPVDPVAPCLFHGAIALGPWSLPYIPTSLTP